MIPPCLAEVGDTAYALSVGKSSIRKPRSDDMTTIPDKEVVRVLNESLIPLTAREIAVNLGYPDPNNAVMCIMRRKLVSLRKYNMVTLAGFSKRDLGGPSTTT